jgi:hypothetical protein
VDRERTSAKTRSHLHRIDSSISKEAYTLPFLSRKGRPKTSRGSCAACHTPPLADILCFYWNVEESRTHTHTSITLPK